MLPPLPAIGNCDRSKTIADCGTPKQAAPFPAASRSPDFVSAALVGLAWSHCDAAGEMAYWHRWNGRAERQVTLAASLIDQAAELYQDETGNDLPPEAALAALRQLIAEADAWLAQQEAADADALADGVESGDLGPDGSPLPYPRYQP